MNDECAGVEGHHPLVFPFLESLKLLLESLCVSFCLDFSVELDEAVISKEAAG